MELQRGDRVRVSNGQPEPPKHHKKKHREWEFRNFEGYVWDCDSLGVSVGKTPDAAVLFNFPHRMITKQ